MNILMLNYEFPPLGGGAANANYYILKELINYKDIKIDLVTASIDKFKIEEFNKNIKIHYIDIKKNIKRLNYQTINDLLRFTHNSFKYCRELINKNEYDFIHAFFGIPCGYIAMKLKLPYIVSLRGSDVPFYNKRFFLLDKFFFKNLSKKIWNKAIFVIANSKGLKELANKTNLNQKIEVIYNGIDTNQFKKLQNKKNKIIKILSVGRLIKRKGYEYLIKALSGMDNIELSLIGDGNIKNKLEQLSKNLKVKINFIGRVEHDKLINYYNNADLFVLPSLNEGMSNSILEAMACSLPIIATDVGGSKELINDNGFIVNKADIGDLRRAILNYINDKSLIKKHSTKSKKIVESLSWANVVEQYYYLYKRVKNQYD